MNEQPAAPDRGEYASELLESISEVLVVLQAVSSGDLSPRLAFDYPDTHPVGALAESVNAMIEALSEARATALQRSSELNRRIDEIERQREAIRTLAVPVIEVWRGVLCVPVVGVLDTMQATEVTSTLLNAVVAKKARFVVVDVTGIDVMDTRAADHFLRMARAVMLLGSSCALSGIRPAIAGTIVHLGVDLGEVKTYRTMRDALVGYVAGAASQRR
ncbi:MAG TPA: STAS domain-containing protein [Polyangiaceae bacterium]